MSNPYDEGSLTHALYNVAVAERNLVVAVCRSLKVDALVAWLAKRLTRS